MSVDATARKPLLLAAGGLVALYLALMSGHLMSIDGLVMWRQAIAVTYHHSWSLVPTIWWGGDITSSYRGIGASLQYVPSLVAFWWLGGHIPVQAAPQYDFRLFYGDILYVVAGAPVWVACQAVTAYIAGLITRALGGDVRLALWAMAFYGLGSPALMAARGDTPQALVALTWAAAVWACLRYNETGGSRWLWISGLSIAYSVLTRPLEGSMLLPGVLVVLIPSWRRNPGVAAGQLAGWAGAVLITLLLNWARFGSPTNFGYKDLGWTAPLWLTGPADLVSPGRGLLWEFPAVVLAVPAFVLLWRTGRRLETVALAGVPVILFVEAAAWWDWVGGWDWGFRFFQPALPLLAAVAALGVATLPSRLRPWLPAVLLAGGLAWNVPAVATDILGGYGYRYAFADANWRLDAYPPIGAWRFLHHVFPTNGADGGAIDNVWFRATRLFGKVALVPFALLLVAAAALWAAAVRAAGARVAA